MDEQVAAEIQELSEIVADVSSRLDRLARRVGASPVVARPADRSASRSLMAALLDASTEVTHKRHRAETAESQAHAAAQAARVAAVQHGACREQVAQVAHEIEQTRETLSEENAWAVSRHITQLESRHERLQRELDEMAHQVAAAETAHQAATRHVREAHAELGALEARLEAARAAFQPQDNSTTPVRTLVLQALGELQAPATSALLAEYVRVRFGRDVDTSRFGPLRRDEERAYVAAARTGRDRPAWLVPGLAGAGLADRTYLTRSDWDLGRRCTDTSPDLRALYHLCRTAGAPPLDTADPEGLWGLLRRSLEPWSEAVGRGADPARAADAVQQLLQRMEEGRGDPERPTTPAHLEAFAASAERTQLLFGADHDLELDDPRQQTV